MFYKHWTPRPVCLTTLKEWFIRKWGMHNLQSRVIADDFFSLTKHKLKFYTVKNTLFLSFYRTVFLPVIFMLNLEEKWGKHVILQKKILTVYFWCPSCWKISGFYWTFFIVCSCKFCKKTILGKHVICRKKYLQFFSDALAAREFVITGHLKKVFS